MPAARYTFTPIPHGLKLDEVVDKVNTALLALSHDLEKSVVYRDTRARTITVSPTFSVPVNVSAITAPATLTSAAQLYIDTADDDLKVRFRSGVLKTIATDP